MCIPAREGSATLTPSKEINEAILAALWNEQAYLRGPMWDCRGEPVAVVYRGRWTAGSGPDFEGALLSLGEGGGVVAGSVEMHLRCADWWAHGHDRDPRYNNVALHVVLWPQGARPVVRADGQEAPTIVLADYITLTAAELLDRVAPLAGNLGALSEEPCHQRTQNWPLDRLTDEIDAAGDARLLSKAAAMQSDLAAHLSPDEVFYRGLMDALGYSANREPMRELAASLPIEKLLLLPLTRDDGERAVLFESVLLGAGGFLPSQRPHTGPLDWLSAQYAEEAEHIWRAHAPTLGLHPDIALVGGWNLDRVRPANSPPRRLAAAARILAHLLWERGGMLAPFLSSTLNPPKRAANRWAALLQVPAEGYWAAHSDFGRALSGDEEVALVGTARAADIVVNIVLPLMVAHAETTGDDTLYSKALEVYAAHPRLSENRITRAMADEALGPNRLKAVNSARRQQGLIHLYRLYCEARRCYECPLSGLRGGRSPY